MKKNQLMKKEQKQLLTVIFRKQQKLAVQGQMLSAQGGYPGGKHRKTEHTHKAQETRALQSS